MVKQEDFAVEQFMDKYETSVQFNMAETCSASISFNELFDLLPDQPQAKQQLEKKIFDTRLTYGHIKGSPDLRNAIAQLYNADGGTSPIAADDVVITNGAIGANFLTLYALVDEGDKVIVVRPTYQQLESVSKIFGGKENVIPWQLKFDKGYLPDLNELRTLIAQHSPKLLIINNPNNPTGVVWDDKTMEEIVAVCKENSVFVMCDEVYRPLYVSDAGKPKSVVNYGYANAVSTSSTSKAFALAGLRLGWIVCRNPEVIKKLLSKRDYNTISVSTVDDAMATFALQNLSAILGRNKEILLKNLAILEEYINNTPFLSWVKPKGGTTCFIKVDVPGIDTMEMCVELVEKYGTLIVPGEVFSHKGYLRVGFGNSTEDIEQGLVQLTAYFKSKKLL
ncbi:Capreomycidine synthase [Candida viswanathii]|uniref:Capreomycidine synthase n=1 Tax=Candida viswanathii TaxID=5486 RepID=A0A367YKT1_9ASCO|nr:Capreomycidine synthase [Candida viswanathii]